MPAPLFWAYVRMLPRLEAGESLRQVGVAGATEGRMMRSGPRERFLDELEERAEGIEPEHEKKPVTASRLNALGIKLKLVPKG